MKVLMIEGRPAEHPIHRAYAMSVGADFIFIDHFLKYQGKRENKVLILLSWFLTACYILFKRKYSVYFCGGPCPPLLFLKKIGLINRNKRIVCLAANETLYFLKEKKYSSYTEKLYINWYNNIIDGVICVGSFQEMLARELIINSKIIINKIFNGLPESFFELAYSFNYNESGKDLICIANGPSGFRVYYKGIDLTIKVFEEHCITSEYTGKLFIIGDWDQNTIDSLLQSISPQIRDRIIFTGKVDNYISYLSNVGLSIHFSRGDSFPTSNLETLALGIPTIVSKITGTAEIIEKINKEWIVPIDIKLMEQSIQSLFKLTSSERSSWSKKAKAEMQSYKHVRALEIFEKNFNQIVRK